MNIKQIAFWLVGAVLLAGTVAMADVKLPAIFNSNMVIQRDVDAPIWGWGEPGEKITVTGSWGKSAEITTPKNGKWELKLATPNAGGPFTLTIQGKNRIELKNVLAGDVWLCSGQSNMAWTVKNSNNAKEEIAAANYPKIRLFKVRNKVSLTPLSDTSGIWSECTPVAVKNFSAAGYYFGRSLYKKLNVPIGLINSSWGGTCIEAWTPWSAQQNIPAAISRRSSYDRNAKKYDEAVEKEKFEKKKAEWQKKTAEWKAAGKKGRAPRRPRFYIHPHKNPNYPVNLYNGMINPILPFAIKGAIWYQGESNAGGAKYYRKQLEAMITAWRKVWQQGDFPVYFVQLPNFRTPAKNPVEDSSWPQLREAFMNTAKEVPNTGMAITMDIGEATNIHPKNKQDVGDRLARVALFKTYGKKAVVWTGPIYKRVKISGNKAIVTFENGGSPLAVKGQDPLKWFALVDAKGNTVAADAKITGPDTVEVSSPKVKQITMVYYAWANNPVGVNLINKAGLPASPFRWGKMPVWDAAQYLPAEAKGYQLVYKFDPTNPKLTNGNKNIEYQKDNSAKITGPFKKIAYFMALQDKKGNVQYAFVSMDPFTDDVKKIGAPVKSSGARFQQNITNCLVKSNVPGVKNGNFAEGCNIEFWDCNYGGGNATKVPEASGKYDFGDTQSTNKSPGYGSMQIHNFKEKQSIICFNKFSGRRNADVGIGTNPKGNPDWTFSSNARNMSRGSMMVMVLK
ncbi:MAG: sialate O-acetylesterase [Victivallaceae bacterium]|nr:sialate O-acetylesterase [Victivallaceae bacterium]